MKIDVKLTEHLTMFHKDIHEHCAEKMAQYPKVKLRDSNNLTKVPKMAHPTAIHITKFSLVSADYVCQISFLVLPSKPCRFLKRI